MFKPLNLIRSFCLLVVLLGVGISWVYAKQSGWIYAVDWHITKWHERSLGSELKGLKAKGYKGDEAERVARLDEIRVMCEGDVQGERLFDPWRIATELQVEALLNSGKLAEAREILEGALSKNPRNLSFVFSYLHVLISAGSSADLTLAESMLEEWQRKIPSHPEIWSLTVLLKAHQADAEGVAQVLRDRLPGTIDALRSRWQMFLFPEGKGKVVKSVPIDFLAAEENGAFELEHEFVTPPKTIKLFRLDPPGYHPQRLIDFKVQMWVGDTEVDSELTAKWKGLSEASYLADGSIAVRIHEDPRLRMLLKGGVSTDAALKVRVTGHLAPLLNLSAREALSDPQFRNQVLKWVDEPIVDLVSPLVSKAKDAQ
ncbi:MAG: tetratricopeptide repeat protein [Planctomycetota bacterium]|nr:tetratricopeptide repeat protein [Planctomycetota bacterium]